MTREDQKMELFIQVVPFFPPTHTSNKRLGYVSPPCIPSLARGRESIPAAGESKGPSGGPAAAPGPSETPSLGQAHTT